MATDVHLRYLHGYPPELLAPVRELIDAGRLSEVVAQRPIRRRTTCAPNVRCTTT